MPDDSVQSLVRSVQLGELDIIKEAVKNDRKLAQATDSNGCSLLHWACLNNRRSVVHYLLENGAHLNYSGGTANEIALQWAVRNDKYAMLVQHLIEQGSELTHKSVDGMDALHVACRSGSVKMAFLLLSAGAYVDSADGGGETPLHWCLKNQNETGVFDLLRLLLTFGADCRLKDAHGNNAFHLIAACSRGFTDTKFAHLITEKAERDNRNISDALFTAKNHLKQVPYMVAVKKNKSYVLRFFWDIFLFRNAPSFTPDLATALGTALPFFSVYWFKWSYIALLFVALSLFLSEKFTLPTITTSKTGLAWGIIATAEYSYYINVGPEFETLINSVVIFIGLAICYTLHRACSTRAHSLPPDVDRYSLVRSIVHAGAVEGPLPPNTVEDFPSAELAPHVHAPKLCTTCLADKSKATMHCSKCNMCVVDLDHHCPFVGNCVGRGNRRVFVFFTLFAAFGCMLNTFLSILVQHVVTCPNEKGILGNFFAVQDCVRELNPFFFVAPWLALLTSIWIWLLFFHQVWMISAATTTFDVVRGNHDGSGNSFAVAMKNIREFFRTGSYQVIPKKCSAHGCRSHSHAHAHDQGRAHTMNITPSQAQGHSHGHAQRSGASMGDVGSSVIGAAASHLGSLSAAVAPIILGASDDAPHDSKQYARYSNDAHESHRKTSHSDSNSDMESGPNSSLLGTSKSSVASAYIDKGSQLSSQLLRKLSIFGHTDSKKEDDEESKERRH